MTMDRGGDEGGHVWGWPAHWSIDADRDGIRGIDDDLPRQEVGDFSDRLPHGVQPKGEDDAVGVLHGVAIVQCRACRTSNVSCQLFAFPWLVAERTTGSPPAASWRANVAPRSRSIDRTPASWLGW